RRGARPEWQQSSNPSISLLMKLKRSGGRFLLALLAPAPEGPGADRDRERRYDDERDRDPIRTTRGRLLRGRAAGCDRAAGAALARGIVHRNHALAMRGGRRRIATR